MGRWLRRLRDGRKPISPWSCITTEEFDEPNWSSVARAAPSSQVPQPADLIHLMDGVISSTKRAWNMAGVVSNPMDYRDHRRVRGDGPLGPAIRRAQRTNGQTTRRGVRDAGAVATTCRKTKIKPGRVCPKHWYRQNPVFFTVYHHICDKS